MAHEPGSVPMSTFSIRIPTATKEQIDTLARALRRSRNFLLAEAVERYVQLQAQQLAHITEGLSDLEAGRVHAHEEIEELVRDFERLAQDSTAP